MRPLELDFAQVSVAEKYRVLPEDFQDCFWTDAELRFKEYKKSFLESCLEAEAESIARASWHEKTKDRVAFRNGYRVRKSLKTHGFGDITDFKVPRLRGVLYESKILVKYQRRSIKFDYDLMKLYVTQTSTRGIKRIVKQLFGTSISPTTVSAALQKVQEKLNEWRKRTLTKEYEALVLDGLYINLRTIPKAIKNVIKYSKNRHRDTQGVILAVMGITAEGVKEIIGFNICQSESEANWYGIINDLLNRGLKLRQDGVIIHDGLRTIASVVDSLFTYHKKQLCTFHFIQGIAEYAHNREERKEAQKGLSQIYDLSPNARTAERLFWSYIGTWRQRNPSIARYVRAHFTATLTYFFFPAEKHQAYRTTNYLERTFKEFNRKTYDVGVFPNVQSAERIVFLLVLERNLATTGENPFYEAV